MAEELEKKKAKLTREERLARKARRERKRKKLLEAEMTPKQKFDKAMELKHAIRCMLKVKDQYMIYLKLADDFEALAKKDLPEEGEPVYDFEGQEKIPELVAECREKAALLEKEIPSEEEEEEEYSRTVTVTERQRQQDDKTKKKGKGKWIFLGLIVVIVLIVVAFHTEPSRYAIAVIEKTCGFKDQARDMFKSVNYSDSEKQAADLEQTILKETKKGRKVDFGKDGTEWTVLDKTDDAVLLIKNESEPKMLYHQTETPVSWEKCDARRYLNGTYLDELFTESEKALIRPTQVTAAYNTQYGTGKNGVETTDKVFILSAKEAVKYKKYLGTKMNNMRLRNPGKEETTTEFTTGAGAIVRYGFPVNEKGALIRPAMWVSTAQG